MPARCPYLNARAQSQTRFFYHIFFKWINFPRMSPGVFSNSPGGYLRSSFSKDNVCTPCYLRLSTLASSSLATCMHVGLRCTICSHFYTKRLSHPSTPQMKKRQNEGREGVPQHSQISPSNLTLCHSLLACLCQAFLK